MSYQPNKFALTQKSLGVSRGVPTDARSWYYDDTNLLPRPFASTAEVLAYLNTADYRSGHFPIFINSGGTLDPTTGVITGGVNTEYWFRNGVLDSHLVRKYQDVTAQDITNWNTTPTLTQVLTAGSDSSASAKFSSVFIKGTTLTNMTELETNATTATRKITFPDATGTPILTINSVAPNTTTGNIALDFYTTAQTYTKTEVDAIVGSGGGGVAGVTTFNSRTGAVVPTTGDYTKAMVGLGNVDNTSDATKDAATTTLTNKTLTAPKIATILTNSGAATLTLPTTTGTVALLAQITGNNTGTNTGDETATTIKTKLGITTLSGSNTGDQDLSGLVSKVTGKSLILDTEITRLATVTNQTITAGTNVTVTGSSSTGYTISSTGGSGGTGSVINVPAGTNSTPILAGTLIDVIIVDAPTSTTFKMGYTSGAEDVVSSTPVSGVQPIGVTEYTKINQTYYFTKASDTSLKIYTR